MNQIETSKTVKFINKVKENRTKIFTTAVFIFIVIFFVVFVYVRIQAVSNSASDKLNTAEQIISSGNIEQGMAIIDDLIKNYKNTSAAYRAEIIKASNLIYQEKYEQAEPVLKHFIENAKPEIIRPTAYPLLISVYNRNGSLDKAINLSKEFLSKYETNYLSASVKENLARLYEKNNQKQENEKIL